jgi:hypothetical protein
MCHHPTRWARNMKAFHKQLMIMSPSHTVGSELRLTDLKTTAVLSHHPTRWARNKQHDATQKELSHHPTRWARNSIFSRVSERNRRHHPTRWAQNILIENNLSCRVTIPHGGLGTEINSLNTQLKCFSHHPTRWARNSFNSPSCSSINSDVTIPHGGLGTISRERVRVNKTQVTIPHGGLGTEH